MSVTKYRVLIIAILISCVWHIFWLSAVKVVFTPAGKGPIKFSRVSFLGPILTRVAMDLRAEPKSRSFLETRYLARLENLTQARPWRIENSYIKNKTGRDSYICGSEKLPYFIDEAVSGQKLDPVYNPE